MRGSLTSALLVLTCEVLGLPARDEGIVLVSYPPAVTSFRVG